jgi:predicted RNase H-like HicB family nuclease
MHKYEVIIYWSADDSAFIAEVPELPGCMAHGPTQAKALSSANQAIKLWLSTARESGRVIPDPKEARLIYA